MKVFDKETTSIIEATKDTEMKKLEEVKRHNLVVEESIRLETKKLELSFKMELFLSFKKLQDSGQSEERILMMFPEMEMFCSV